jgi:hypothetical protein
MIITFKVTPWCCPKTVVVSFQCSCAMRVPCPRVEISQLRTNAKDLTSSTHIWGLIMKENLQRVIILRILSQISWVYRLFTSLRPWAPRRAARRKTVCVHGARPSTIVDIATAALCGVFIRHHRVEMHTIVFGTRHFLGRIPSCAFRNTSCAASDPSGRLSDVSRPSQTPLLHSLNRIADVLHRPFPSLARLIFDLPLTFEHSTRVCALPTSPRLRAPPAARARLTPCLSLPV